MKLKLIILSLSPLCLLALVMNFKFIYEDSSGVRYIASQFLIANLSTLVMLALCAIWCVSSVFIYFYFRFITSFGKEGAFSIKDSEEEKEAGLSFFLTLILPLMIGDFSSIQSTCAFVIVFIIVFFLLCKTDLFYQNPILALLGYHIYKFSFCDNSKRKEPQIGVSLCSLNSETTIEYKEIAGSVIFTKPIKGGQV